MAQADYIISNQTFPNTRADINNHLSAIATNNSGTSAPTTQYAGQFWIDTTSTTWTLYIHDGTDDIQFATIDTSANTVNFTDSALDVVTDTTPQLGGNLDLNSNDITGTGNINITGTATVTGLTTTGDINFGDNDKAVFGAGSDLQIYHNVSDSIIEDVGQGNLILAGNTQTAIRGTSGGDNVAVFNTGADVKLYYNGSPKIATTSSGIDVTGKTTTDSIDAVGGQSGSTPIVKIENSVGDNLVSFKRTTGTPSDEFAIGADSASLHFKNETLSTYIMSLSEGGDISFYEDTGTTPKLFWDASEERLGVGTASPQTPLHVYRNSAGTSNIRLENTESYISIRADNDSGIIDANTHIFKSKDGSTEYMRIDSSGNVGIGTSNPDGSDFGSQTGLLHLANIGGNNTGIKIEDGTTKYMCMVSGGGDVYTGTWSNNNYRFYTNITERMRIDNTGNVLVGTTNTDPAFNNVVGQSFAGTGQIQVTRDGGIGLLVNRKTSDGDIVQFRKDGATIGNIGSLSSSVYLAGSSKAIYIGGNFRPATTTGSDLDDNMDCGVASARWDDVYATNGTIQTSDQNEKQSIQSLTASEIAVAQRISKLFKTFKWNSAVEEKGDNARTHTGIIAQDVQQAFADEGLDASNYALFISSTWWEKEISVDAVAPQEAVYETQTDEEGNEIQVLVQEAVEGKDAYTYIDTKEEATEGYTQRTRLGIRYPELLSFVSSAFEQRLTNIETRLTALET